MGKLAKLWKDRDKQMHYARWLFRYSKPYLWKIILMLLVNISSTGASLYMVTVSKKIIDEATDIARKKGVAGTIAEEAIKNDALKTVIPLIALYIGIMLLMQILSICMTVMSTKLNEKFCFGVRKQIYEKIINSHWMDVKRYHTGDLMTRLTSDAGNIADGIIGTIPSILTLGIQLVMVFFTLFHYSPLLAVFGLLCAPVAALTGWLIGRKMKKVQVKVQESESKYRSFLQESLANLLIVKSFANEDYSAKKLTELRDNRFFWVFKRVKLGVASTASLSLSFQLGYITAFTYGAIKIATGAITYGTMSVFLSLVNRVQAPIIGLAEQVPRIVSILASAGRIMELQNIPLEEKLEGHIEANKVGVKVENVTFGYIKDENVLKDISMEIKPGETVAIIGESGIGKTTLIRLVMSFMRDYEGKISFYNEKGETETANAGTRNFISYVPQGNTLFSGTIRENIRMGNLNATTEEMYDALKLASGYDFVMELPDKIDTVIGERGHGISEGQAQRIAIARALVRKAPFLILDEATSSLDMETEQKVILGLQSLKPRPTCLIVTHRKSILEYCDREIVIKDKRMEEVKEDSSEFEDISLATAGGGMIAPPAGPFIPGM